MMVINGWSAGFSEEAAIQSYSTLSRRGPRTLFLLIIVRYRLELSVHAFFLVIRRSFYFVMRRSRYLFKRWIASFVF